MDLDFSAEQEQLRASVRRFLAERVPLTAVRSSYGVAATATDEAWQGLCGLGVSALLAPESAGGLGLGMVDLGVVLEEGGRGLYGGPLVSSAVGAVSAVSLLDPESALLPGLAVGSVVATLAVHEPDAHYDWATPSTRCAADRLTGEKAHVLDGALADVLLVTARDEDGLGVYVVRRDAAGLTVVPTETYDGSRSWATVSLDGVEAERLGSGDATATISVVVDRVTAALVSDGVGAAERCLELAVGYAKEREQFGAPIGSFQAVQHLCADMLQWLEMGRAGVHYALWALDAADPAEGHRAATMAKAWASDAFYRVGANAVQVFGGVGFTWEHDVGLYYKRLLGLQQAWGDSAHHLEQLATQIL